jgi:hypothetical protein
VVIIPAVIGGRAPGLAASRAAVTSILGGEPIGRRAAQRLARDELSKVIYHPREPLTQRVLRVFWHWLIDLFNTGNSVPGGWWALVALAAIAVVVIALVMTRIGPVARRYRRGIGPVPGSRAATARDHRLRAGQLANLGDYSGAILECVRAIARQLEERGILAARAGLTADEIADEAGRVLPGDADALRAAARLFDDVCYGQRHGTQDGYQRLLALDARITAAQASQPAEPVAAAQGSGPR